MRCTPTTGADSRTASILSRWLRSSRPRPSSPPSPRPWALPFARAAIRDSSCSTICGERACSSSWTTPSTCSESVRRDPSPAARREGAGIVTDILQAAPKVKVLVTSRARLHVQGEQLLPVAAWTYPSLAPPALTPDPSPADGGRGACKERPAVQRRAACSWRQCAPRAARLCADSRRPGPDRAHLPLGGGDAAGHRAGGALGQSAARGRDRREPRSDAARARLFGRRPAGDVPERQRSMRAVFDHSWNLLSERQQAVLAALSVFRGGLHA